MHKALSYIYHVIFNSPNKDMNVFIPLTEEESEAQRR